MTRTSALLAAALLLGLLTPLAGAADPTNGSRIYMMHCAACHGVKGQSPIPNTPNFAAGERLMQPDMMLVQHLRTGKGIAPSFMGILRDQEMLDVISYIRTLQSRR